MGGAYFGVLIVSMLNLRRGILRCVRRVALPPIRFLSIPSSSSSGDTSDLGHQIDQISSTNWNWIAPSAEPDDDGESSSSLFRIKKGYILT